MFSAAECTLFGFSIKALWEREASEQRLTLHTLLQMMPAKSLIQFSNKYKALSPSLSLSFLCLFHLWLSYLQFHCNSSEERPAKSMLKSSGLQLSKQCDSSFCLLDLLTVWLKRDCTFQLSSVKMIPVQEGKRETFRERTELHDRLWTTTVGVNTISAMLTLSFDPCVQQFTI